MMTFFRSAGLALVVAGCAGTPRPTVVPAVSSLPDEPEEREERLASAAARPSVETGPASAGVERADTVAATLAAFLGMIFSTTENALVGIVVPIDENRLVAPMRDVPRRQVDGVEPAEPPPP